MGKSGRYRWWIDGVPIRFEGTSRDTEELEPIPGFEIPGYRIPFLTDATVSRYHGMDAVGMHYGVAGRDVHVSYFGKIRVRT